MTDAPLPEDRDSATDRNAATDQTTMVTQNATEQLGNDELPSSPTGPDEGLSYEQARDELIETVKILELGQMSLDESLKHWERGEALAKRCEVLLDGAQKRVETALGAGEASGGEEE